VFEVNFWGSHPDAGNDDCWIAVDVRSLDEARAFVKNPTFPSYVGHPSGTAFFEIVDANGNPADDVRIEVHPNPLFNAAKRDAKRRADDMMDRSEFSMQNGMAFGCDGYNDAEGY